MSVLLPQIYFHDDFGSVHICVSESTIPSGIHGIEMYVFRCICGCIFVCSARCIQCIHRGHWNCDHIPFGMSGHIFGNHLVVGLWNENVCDNLFYRILLIEFI